MKLTVDSSQVTFLPTSKSRGQLPAPIVNGRGDSFWKWTDFQLWRVRDLDLGLGHTAYRRASLIDIYLHAKFHWNRRNFLWNDGHTHVGYISTYVRTFETGFIRSTMLKSRPNNTVETLARKIDVWFKKTAAMKRSNASVSG